MCQNETPLRKSRSMEALTKIALITWIVRKVTKQH